VAILTINRPQANNALTTAMAASLTEFLDEIAARVTVRVAILTGAANQAFCLGMDLRERNEMTKEQWLRQRANIDRLIYTVRQLRRPIFAAGGRVNPWTSGRGRSSVRSCAPHCSPRHIQAGSQ
jgi:enoyl-CoA hydratase